MKPKLRLPKQATTIQFGRDPKVEELSARPHVRLARIRRRMLVVALFLVITGAATWAILLSAGVVSGNKAVSVIYYAVGLLGLLVAALAYAVGAMNGRNSRLDERERAIRDRANTLAYRILAVTIGGLLFIALTANTFFGWQPNVKPAVGLLNLGLPLLWFIGILPTAILAWMVPDPDPDIDDEVIAQP